MSGEEEYERSPGVEVMTNGVRVRVFFPHEAWARFQKMAKRMAMDDRTAIRMLASLQLAQLEAQHQSHPELEEKIREAVVAEMNRRFAELYPEGLPKPDRKR